MKQLITILAVTLSLSAFSATAQAASVKIAGAPDNFSKAKFKQLQKAKGLSQQEYNQIGGMHAVINSSHKVNGQWKFQISNNQIAQLIQFTKGNLQFHSAEMGADEFFSAEIGADEFVMWY